MSTVMDLKTAERKAFQLSTSEDGLYDVFLGAYIMLLSATPWLDENGLSMPWNMILGVGLGFGVFIGVLLLKKYVVAPRIGQVKFGPARKQRLLKLAIGMAVIFVLTLVLFSLTVSAIYFQEPRITEPIETPYPFDVVHTLAGIFIFALFSGIGYFNDYPRLYFYGFLFGLGYVISTILQDITGNSFYWPWSIAGLTAVVVGLVQFVRFLRAYPRRSEAE